MIVEGRSTSNRISIDMPSAPRIKNNRATKVAWKILGIPANISFKRNADQRRVNKKLVFEETQRVR